MFYKLFVRQAAWYINDVDGCVEWPRPYLLASHTQKAALLQIKIKKLMIHDY